MNKLFRTITVEEKVAQSLNQAQLDRLDAQAQAEYWKAISNMLDDRVKRLQATNDREARENGQIVAVRGLAEDPLKGGAA